MANFPKLRTATAAGLPAPPKPAETLGNVKAPSLLELSRQRREEKAAEAQVSTPAEEPKASKRAKGRPKLDYSTRQLGARVRSDTFDRVTAISKRERVGLGPLVDRMVREWERMRLEQAAAMGPRLEGEDDDAYIARVFRL